MQLNNLICETRIYTEKIHTHNHPHSQLILPLQGSLLIKTDESEINLNDKYLFFLPSHCYHSYHSNNTNESLVLDIPEEISETLLRDMQECVTRKTLDEKWKAVRYLLYEEARNKNERGINNLVNYMCGFLLEKVRPASIQYVHDNFQKQIHIKKLAEIESFNVSYYIEWFHKKTGMTPNSYIQKLRLDEAKEYLENTDLSLLMISELVGYEQQSSFTRLFINHQGIPPSEYRKKSRIMAKNSSV